MYEWMEMLERNKDGSLPTPAILWIISVCKRKPKAKELNYCLFFASLLHSNLKLWFCRVVVFWQKIQTVFAEVMMIPQRIPEYLSDYSRIKRKIWKYIFQASLERLVSFIYHENLYHQNVPLALDCISSNFP